MYTGVTIKWDDRFRSVTIFRGISLASRFLLMRPFSVRSFQPTTHFSIVLFPEDSKGYARLLARLHSDLRNYADECYN